MILELDTSKLQAQLSHLHLDKSSQIRITEVVTKTASQALDKIDENLVICTCIVKTKYRFTQPMKLTQHIIAKVDINESEEKLPRPRSRPKHHHSLDRQRPRQLLVLRVHVHRHVNHRVLAHTQTQYSPPSPPQFLRP